MRRMSIISLSLALLVGAGSAVNESAAQEASNHMSLASRSTLAVSYLARTRTTLDLVGTSLMPRARGKVDVETPGEKPVRVKTEIRGLQRPSLLGPEYLTYVLWAITPQGQPKNLGELPLDGDHAEIQASVEFQTFGLVVTAEPYFAVILPSDAVVAENVLRPETKGKVAAVNVEYELMPRGSYAAANTAEGSAGPVGSAKDPLDLRQARNAVHIAQLAAADKYAAENYARAKQQLNQAEDYYANDLNEKTVIAQARSVVQTAEEARMIAVRRQNAEREEMVKQAAIQAEARRREAAERERQEAEQLRAAAQQQQAAAEESRRQAELEANRAQAEREAAERAKEEAEIAQRTARAQQLQAEVEARGAREEADEQARRRREAEIERAELRAKLLRQFNEILPTHDTDRGIVVDIGDVLFDLNRYTLRSEAREKLARFAGIVLNYPSLDIECEGHTDSTGPADYNQRLSEKRAQTVADYLNSLGVGRDRLGYEGLGETDPVALNDTAAGRRRNRRVELVVSGEVIGTPLRGRLGGS